eukprot:1160780-Pelagomonas_calceolata.AAC.3
MQLAQLLHHPPCVLRSPIVIRSAEVISPPVLRSRKDGKDAAMLLPVLLLVHMHRQGVRNDLSGLPLHHGVYEYLKKDEEVIFQKIQII